MVKAQAVHKFTGVVVFVWWKKLTAKSIVGFQGGPKIKRKTRRNIQAGKRALGHVINEISSKSRDVQVRVFFLYEVDVTYTTVGSIAADNFIRFF